MSDLIFIILRSVVVYLFIIFAIRLFGKKELSQLSVVDLVFILLISNSVQNAMVGNNTTLVGGLTAALGLFICNLFLKQVIFTSKKFGELLQGDPLMLIYHGKVIKAHLDKAKITDDELEAAVREHGVDDFADVNLAVLEVDGSISILSDNFNKKSSRKRKAHKYLTQQD